MEVTLRDLQDYFFFYLNKKDVLSLVLTNKFVNLNLTKPQTFET